MIHSLRTTWRWAAVVVASCACLDPVFAQNTPPLGAEARSQITALQSEKEARTPAQRKMDSRLVHLSRKQRGERLGAGLQSFENSVKVSEDGLELVDLQCKVSDALLAALRAAGGQIVASVPRFNSIRVRLPVAQLEAIAAREDVSFVKPAVRAMTHVGAVNTEGDVAHRSNTTRTTLRATGRGVRIGVISDSVDSLPLSQSTGDLGPVTVLPGQSGLGFGLSGEGTAMLEIIHDLAPDAELFFASAFISEAQFAQNILDLRAAGCDIIVDDVGYFDESPLQDGPVAQAVNEIVADGGLYFSAAGNEGNKNDGTSGVWEGDFADAGPSGAVISKAGRLHSFGATDFNELTEASGIATLFWSDPAGASSNDYDLYVLDPSGQNILAASTNFQSGSQDPYEIVDASVTGSRMIVVKSPAAEPRFLHLNTLRGRLGINTSGTIQGHPAAAGAFAVAATPAAGVASPFLGGISNPVETFSTDGDRRVFFHSDGTPVTPGNFSSTGGTVRLKPDITAADGVRTSVPGFDPFFGTSAAAPHAAAIAAQIWSRNRALSPQQVRAALTSTAVDIEAAGVDRDSGVGIVNALAATQAVTGGAIIVPGTVTITAESYGPANGRIDPGETVTVSVPVQNIGPTAAQNLTATLLSTGGIFNPSAPQSYGPLAVSATASRTFTFQGNGPIGGSATATFKLTDGPVNLGTFTANFTTGTIGAVVNFTNAVATAIPDSGPATPYPSTISVSGFSGRIGKITVRLSNFTHTFPADLDVLLVSPSGKKVELMSDAGGGNSVSGITLTFDDTAPSGLGSTLATGTFRPTPLDSLTKSLPAPAPAAPYQSALSAFSGESANGRWELYIRDEFGGDLGSLGSWSLSIAPNASLTGGAGPDITPALVQSQESAALGSFVSYTTTVYNNGAAAANTVVLTDVLPPGLAFASATTTAGTVTNSGGTVTASIGTILAGQNAVVTINATCAQAGTFTNTVSVSLTGVENSGTNNSSSSTILIGLPNLEPAQPTGWSDELVISKAPGTNTDAESLTSSDPIFIDLAFTNSGTLSANAYSRTELFVDGVVRRTIEQQLPVRAGRIEQEVDLSMGTFPPGIHSVLLKVDTLNTVRESIETDNTFTKTFFIDGPNLAPVPVHGSTASIVLSRQGGTTTDAPVFQTSDSLFLDCQFANNGQAVTGLASIANFLLDGTSVMQIPISATLGAGQSLGALDIPLGALTAGTHTVRVILDDGAVLPETDETDNTFTKEFKVNAAPSISTVADQEINEDEQTASIPFTVADAESLVGDLTITAQSSNPELLPAEKIALTGSGDTRELRLTPAANASGTAMVTITIRDESGGISTRSFGLTVNSVNDAPIFIAGAPQSVVEDSGLNTVLNWAQNISAGPLNEGSQAVNFLVTNDNPALFQTQPEVSPSGTLTFTPAQNVNGSAVVTVRLQDSGGTTNTGSDTSIPQMFNIQVGAENDIPTFTLAGAVNAAQDAGVQEIVNFATNISPGPGDESTQIVTFTVSAGAPSLFAVQPAINSSGMLSFTPNATASGESLVTVTATDSGGAVSPPVTFNVAVTSFVEEVGSYHGLVSSKGATASAAQTGPILVSIDNRGRLSGKLSLGKAKYSFKGAVLNNGQISFGRKAGETLLLLKRKNLPDLQLTLSLAVAGDSGKLTGSVQDGPTLVAGVVADRATYHKKTNPAPSEIVGNYSVIFPAKTPAEQGRPATEFPQGTGFGRLSVDSGGTAKLKGVLADGSKVNASGPLSKANEWSLFASTDRKRGSISGRVAFADIPNVSDAAASDLLWFKPAGSKIYPAGWETGIAVNLLASHLSSTPGSALLPGLSPGGATGNAELVLVGGGLPIGGITKALVIDEKNKVTAISPSADKLNLKLDAKSGLISGSFVHPGTGKAVKLGGAVFQKQRLGSGFFIEGESGTLTLRAPALALP